MINRHLYILRLTVSTEVSMMYREAVTVKLIDVNGQEHFLSKLQVKLQDCIFYLIESVGVSM